jgi:serine/threonine-protein kinase
VFAAGVMIWEAATRQRLWTGQAGPELMRRLLEGNIPRPTTVVPEIPLALEAICMKALARDRDARYQTATELREALEGYLKSRMAQVSPWHAAGFLQRHFKDQREQMRTRIQRVVDELPSEEHLSERRIHLRSRPARERRPASRSSRAPARGPRWLSFLGGAVTIGAVGWGVSWYRQRTEAPPPSTAAPELRPAPLRAPSARVRIRIAAVPASARLYLDGQPLPTNPWELETAVDPTEHAIMAWAEGFGAREARITFDRDHDVVLELPRGKPLADFPPRPLPKPPPK